MRVMTWTGIAFVVSFIASVVVSSPPSDSASNARWIANYATDGKQEQHLATGVLLIVAGLCLAAFLTQVWTLIEGRREQRPSVLPIVAAGIAGACFSVGGALMGVISGDALIGSTPLPDADLLRFCNDLGFVLVGVPGMLAVSLCLVILSVQAHETGLFGARMRWFTTAVALILLASFEFLPIAALLVWVVVLVVALPRRAAVTGRATQLLARDAG
jgi:hypothetical protein